MTTFLFPFVTKSPVLTTLLLAVLFLGSTNGNDDTTDSCLHILLTNDDGYSTLLVNTLFEFLRDDTCHEVVMVAPKGGQSGRGTAIDVLVPSLEQANPSAGIYYLDSTPATVMYYALDFILPGLDFEPDLIVSGPNQGWNIGLLGINSGTIAAAQAGMARGNPAIAVSASLSETDTENPLATRRIAELVGKLIDETVICDDGTLILEGGQGLNVNMPNIYDLATETVGDLDDYDFQLTKVGLASPFGGWKWFPDLTDSFVQQALAGGLLNGFSGLSPEIPYTEAGFPLDEDPDSEGNAIGQLFGPALEPISTFVVTVSPIEFTLTAPASQKVKDAFGIVTPTKEPSKSPKNNKKKKRK